MCLTVFLASAAPLPTIPFVRETPRFYARPLFSEWNAESVRQHFSLPHVYEVGAATGCGCGFYYDNAELSEVLASEMPADIQASALADHEERRESVRALQTLLYQTTASGSHAEIYTCWYGDWNAPPNSRHICSPNDFGGERFHFGKHEFFVVRLTERE